MLAWERQEGESARAYEAFSLYRDMGASRSLAKVGQMLGKSRALMERWSVQHGWVDRVEALEARDEMLRREAIDEHVQAGAEDRAKREAALLERAIGVREKAMDMAEKMVAWPLAEQRVVREGPDGEPATYVFLPSGWTKNTTVAMYNLALGDATPAADAPGGEWDFSNMTEREMEDFLSLSEKLGIQHDPKQQP